MKKQKLNPTEKQKRKDAKELVQGQIKAHRIYQEEKIREFESAKYSRRVQLDPFQKTFRELDRVDSLLQDAGVPLKDIRIMVQATKKKIARLAKKYKRSTTV